MRKDKLRAIFFLIIIVFVMIVTISLVIDLFERNSKSDNDLLDENEYIYNFTQTVDLEVTDTFTEGNTATGTDYPSFGTISEFYDEVEVYTEDNKLYIQSHDGHDVVSADWLDEGFAKYVKEPEFGYLEKFVLESTSASARYNDVKMKDVVSYINVLSGLGFNNVSRDDKNNGKDYYIYSAKKGEVTVTLNYLEGSLLIVVF